MKSINGWNAARDLTTAQRERALELRDDFERVRSKYYLALAATTFKLLRECFSPPRKETSLSVSHLYVPDNTISIEELLGHLHSMSRPIDQDRGSHE